jgi:hypothetical protein
MNVLTIGVSTPHWGLSAALIDISQPPSTLPKGHTGASVAVDDPPTY